MKHFLLNSLLEKETKPIYYPKIHLCYSVLQFVILFFVSYWILLQYYREKSYSSEIISYDNPLCFPINNFKQPYTIQFLRLDNTHTIRFDNPSQLMISYLFTPNITFLESIQKTMSCNPPSNNSVVMTGILPDNSNIVVSAFNDPLDCIKLADYAVLISTEIRKINAPFICNREDIFQPFENIILALSVITSVYIISNLILRKLHVYTHDFYRCCRFYCDYDQEGNPQPDLERQVAQPQPIQAVSPTPQRDYNFVAFRQNPNTAELFPIARVPTRARIETNSVDTI